jgi:hypothetical protein
VASWDSSSTIIDITRDLKSVERNLFPSVYAPWPWDYMLFYWMANFLPTMPETTYRLSALEIGFRFWPHLLSIMD